MIRRDFLLLPLLQGSLEELGEHSSERIAGSLLRVAAPGRTLRHSGAQGIASGFTDEGHSQLVSFDSIHFLSSPLASAMGDGN